MPSGRVPSKKAGVTENSRDRNTPQRRTEPFESVVEMTSVGLAATPWLLLPEPVRVGCPLILATAVPGGNVIVEAHDASCRTTSCTGAPKLTVKEWPVRPTISTVSLLGSRGEKLSVSYSGKLALVTLPAPNGPERVTGLPCSSPSARSLPTAVQSVNCSPGAT